MIVTRMQMYCDNDHGIAVHFPEDGALDGALYTRGDLRNAARKEGWRRIEGMDLCPDCVAIERQSK